MSAACEVRLFGADSGGKPEKIVLVNGEPGETDALAALLADACPGPWALAVVHAPDWNRDLSPWPAKAVFRGAPDFGGGAEAWLRELTGAVLPGLRRDLGCPDAPCFLAGYSLAGLFALWALHVCGDFAGAVSASGSLWYPGFAAFAASRPVPAGAAVYLSLGDAESRTRNPVMRTVEDRTRALAAQYADFCGDAFFELNPGNHFQDPPGRLAKGIRWILALPDRTGGPAMTHRPLIALTSSLDTSDPRQWIRPAYMRSLLDAGALPMILPLTDDPAVLAQALSLCDGVVLTGGPDVDPARYGADDEGLSEVCPERDAMELPLARAALEADKPVLAICRGLQVLNVALGGTLWQDLPSQRPSGTAHRQSAPGAQPTHGARVLPGTPLRAITGEESLRVNSLHHQAIRDLAPGLLPMAEADDGLCEAAYHPGKRFALGVQWHPELMSLHDPASRALFRAFVRAAAGDA